MFADVILTIPGALSCFTAYIVLKIIYRLWFHPLAKFPGPKLAAATSCYEFYHSIIQDGTFPWRIKDMHEKYGT